MLFIALNRAYTRCYLVKGCQWPTFNLFSWSGMLLSPLALNSIFTRWVVACWDEWCHINFSLHLLQNEDFHDQSFLDLTRQFDQQGFCSFLFDLHETLRCALLDAIVKSLSSILSATALINWAWFIRGLLPSLSSICWNDIAFSACWAKMKCSPGEAIIVYKLKAVTCRFVPPLRGLLFKNRFEKICSHTNFQQKVLHSKPPQYFCNVILNMQNGWIY